MYLLYEHLTVLIREGFKIPTFKMPTFQNTKKGRSKYQKKSMKFTFGSRWVSLGSPGSVGSVVPLAMFCIMNVGIFNWTP